MLHLMLKIKTLIERSKIEVEPPLIISNEQMKIDCHIEYSDRHYQLTFVDLITKVVWNNSDLRFLNREKAIEEAQHLLLLTPDEIKERIAKA